MKSERAKVGMCPADDLDSIPPCIPPVSVQAKCKRKVPKKDQRPRRSLQVVAAKILSRSRNLSQHALQRLHSFPSIHLLQLTLKPGMRSQKP
jgi:hypothetical protein